MYKGDVQRLLYLIYKYVGLSKLTLWCKWIDNYEIKTERVKRYFRWSNNSMDSKILSAVCNTVLQVQPVKHWTEGNRFASIPE